MMKSKSVSRREFIQSTGAVLGGSVLASPLGARAGQRSSRDRMRVALVGTGVRGVSMYGRDVVRDYGDTVEMVGVCDINPGRLDYGHEYIGADCPKFVQLDDMLNETDPDVLIVTSWDWEHHNHIIAGVEHGCDVICEKPVTIDEEKAQAILDAERATGRQIIVTHNYRYAPHRAKLKELLMEGAIGDILSVDFHWNINHPHLQQYMRRWHGHRDRGGTLWVHKSTHHFDLVNWWIDSDPVEVFAYGDLERYGAKGPFRGENCRTCPHTANCEAFWDMTQSEHLMKLYAENENYDGYIRDNCVYRETIDVYDKHAAVVRYANNAYLNYSLTAETGYEGFWIAFNGTDGRLEGREGGGLASPAQQEWVLEVRGSEPEVITVPFEAGGHWGGDVRLMDKLFKDPDLPDPLHQQAGTRDGIMSILVGIAARKSIDSNAPVEIAGLTDLEPMAQRPRT